MTTTEDEIEVVTDAEARAAERDAATSEAAARDAEDAIATGQAGVTIDDLEAAEKKSRFAALFAKAQRVKADRYAAAERTKRIKALRDEVITTAPKSGDELVSALAAVEAAAREFVRLADEHDARLDSWRQRVMAFRISDGLKEHGVGLNGIGQLVVNDVTFDRVNGPLVFGGIFANQQTGYAVPLPIRDENDAARAAAYRTLDQIGEGL